jgi:hypothetical protein
MFQSPYGITVAIWYFPWPLGIHTHVLCGHLEIFSRFGMLDQGKPGVKPSTLEFTAMYNASVVVPRLERFS